MCALRLSTVRSVNLQPCSPVRQQNCQQSICTWCSIVALCLISLSTTTVRGTRSRTALRLSLTTDSLNLGILGWKKMMKVTMATVTATVKPEKNTSKQIQGQSCSKEPSGQVRQSTLIPSCHSADLRLHPNYIFKNLLHSNMTRPNLITQPRLGNDDDTSYTYIAH